MRLFKAIFLLVISFAIQGNVSAKTAGRKLLQTGSIDTSGKKWSPGYMWMSTADTVQDWLEKKAAYKFTPEERVAATQTAPTNQKTKEFSYTNIHLNVAGPAETEQRAVTNAALSPMLNKLGEKLGYGNASEDIVSTPEDTPLTVSGPRETTGPFTLDTTADTTTADQPPFTLTSDEEEPRQLKESKVPRRRALLGKNDGWEVGKLFQKVVNEDAQNNFIEFQRNAESALTHSANAFDTGTYLASKNVGDLSTFLGDHLTTATQAFLGAGGIVNDAIEQNASDLQDYIGKNLGLHY